MNITLKYFQRRKITRKASLCGGFIMVNDEPNIV
jgi:hypothetical protein